MDHEDLIAEIKRLNDLLGEASKRAIAQYALIDKLTAANIHVQALLRKLGVLQASGAKRRRRRKATKA